jgi:hypothetical protein
MLFEAQKTEGKKKSLPLTAHLSLMRQSL